MIPWHSPLITPAQGAMIFAACLAVYVILKVSAWLMREPEREIHEHVDGEGR